jgi:hypothetical protein
MAVRYSTAADPGGTLARVVICTGTSCWPDAMIVRSLTTGPDSRRQRRM